MTHTDPTTGDAPDDDLFFLDEGEDNAADSAAAASPAHPLTATPSGQRWKLLIVDDEPEVHSITKLVLSDFAYKGRPAQFISAHSAEEARAILARESDIAMILLDVVMETEDAGLQLVHHIREELKNRHVRIILRTGQPGQAPERAVILDYDINDYKAKTQLTAQQLFTTTVAALRSYEDIMAIEANRRGLQKIIDASSSLFQARSMKLFAGGVLTQLSGLLGVGPDAILCVQRGSVLGGARDGLYVLAGAGRFEPLINEPAINHVDPDVLGLVMACLESRANHYAGEHITLYIRTPNRRENVVYLRSDRPLSDLDRELIEVFCGKISVGFDNLYLYEQLHRAQQGTLAALADLAERRTADEDGDNRFARSLRIAAVTERIARQLRDENRFPEIIDDSFLSIIGLSAILHDVGNAAIDPSITAKPGPLSPDERAAMQRHTLAGADLLTRASRLTDGQTHLHVGADVARWHHENWDGCGYPDGLAGDAIPLSARIVAVADAYDAMRHHRPHRAALSHAATLTEIRNDSGHRFDPVVVAAFLAVEGEIAGL